MKKITAIVLAVVMLLSMNVFVFAGNVTNSGDYSNSYGTVNWVYYPETKTIEFSGFGALNDVSKNFDSYDIDNVVIKDGFNAIYANFFENSSIKTVSISDTVQEIQGYAFSKTNLKQVVIPYSVREIRDYAFSECYELEYVKLPDTLEHIGHSVFASTPFMYSLMDENYCSYAGSYLLKVDSCFSDSDTIDVKYGTTLIAEGVLQDANVKVINIPNTVKYICEDYTNWYSEDYDVDVDDIEVAGGAETKNSCIDLIRYYGTKEQYSKMYDFKPSGSKYEVEILGKEMSKDDSVDAEYGFDPDHSNSAESGSYDKDYGKIGWNYDPITKTLTFNGRGKLKLCPWQRKDVKHVVIGEGITQLGHYLFYDMDIESVTLPETLESIGVNTFAKTSELKQIDLPDNVDFIDCNAFLGSGIESIDLKNVNTIKGAAFYYCLSLSDVVLSSSLEKIPHYAFYWCKALKTIDIPDSVKEICDYAFASSAIETVSLPSGMSFIGEEVFFNTPLKSNTALDKGVAFYLGTYLISIVNKTKNYTVKENTTLIAENAFTSNSFFYTFVEHVTIPNTVRSICNDGFIFDVSGKFGYIQYNTEQTITVDFNGIKEQWDRSYRNPSSFYSVILNIINEDFADSSLKFKDVKSTSWYKQYVDYTLRYDIFEGLGDGNFGVNDNITRAQFVMVLSNISGIDTAAVNVESGFVDVPEGKWYTAAVKWAKESGISNGSGDNRFLPNENITREQICTMLVRYVEFIETKLNEFNDGAVFDDDGDISSWAKDAVYLCKSADLVNGKGENKFDPKASATRAEAAAIFTRYHIDYIF